MFQAYIPKTKLGNIIGHLYPDATSISAQKDLTSTHHKIITSCLKLEGKLIYRLTHFLKSVTIANHFNWCFVISISDHSIVKLNQLWTKIYGRTVPAILWCFQTSILFQLFDQSLVICEMRH